MNSVMFDLETFGTKPGSVLRSVGAVFFDPETGQMGETFYRNIDRASCEAIGLKVDPSTEKWWAGQSREAQDALLKDQRPIAEVASQFNSWFVRHGGVRVWCQGANFDSVLWEAMLGLLPQKLSPPWRFWNVRDTRTVYDVAKFDDKSMPRSGTYHDALADAQHQVRCVAEAIQLIRYP